MKNILNILEYKENIFNRTHDIDNNINFPIHIKRITSNVNVS